MVETCNTVASILCITWSGHPFIWLIGFEFRLWCSLCEGDYFDMLDFISFIAFCLICPKLEIRLIKK